MRLLLICHEFPPTGGGGGRATHALAEELSQRHEVTVITARAALPPLRSGRYEVLAVGPVRRTVFGASALEMLAFAVAAVRVASPRRFDACIAVQSVPAGCVARWLSIRRGVPYVIRLVGADVPGFLPERYGHLEWIMRWVSARTWPHASAVVANSRGLEALASAIAGPLGVTIRVVPNGVDTEFFRPREARCADTAGPIRFVFVGRLVRQKGLRELLEALRRNRARFEGRAVFEIIGDGEEANQITGEIARERLHDLVVLRSWLPREAVVQRLQAADVFVIPSLNEGMPNALLEAMACGLPAIATAVAGNVELIQDRVNGFLVPPRDVAALGAALVEAVDLGPDRLATMGTASRRKALEFSWHRSATAYQEFLTAIEGVAPAGRRSRILLICHEYPPIGGGAATVAAGLARQLAKDHDVTVITSSYAELPRVEREGRLIVRRVKAMRRAMYGASPFEMVGFSVSAIAAGARLCRSQRFDGCIAIQGIPAAWVALPLASMFRFRYVIGLVGADVPGFLPERFDRPHRAIGWLTRWTWRRAAAVVANSASLRTLAERTARPLGITVDMVLYGADTDVHRLPATPRREDVVRFLFVGRLSTQKGISYLVDAIGLAHEALQGRASVVVVGDGEDYGRLVERVRAGGLDDVVTFRGWLSREDLAVCYGEASVFVLSSLDEGRSQAALEAMACGLAMIATDIEGNAGMVDEGVSGYIVPPRDAAALAKALVTMTEMGPRKLAAMRAASRVRVAQFSWGAAADRYVRYFEGAAR